MACKRSSVRARLAPSPFTQPSAAGRRCARMRPCSIAGGSPWSPPSSPSPLPPGPTSSRRPRRAADLAAAGGWQAWAAPTPEGALAADAPSARWRRVAAGDRRLRLPAQPVDRLGPADRRAPARRVLALRGPLLADRLRRPRLRPACWRRGARQRGLDARGERNGPPSLARGVLAFVRRGEGVSGKGVYTVSLGRPGASPRRISPQIARETATNGSRVAYAYRSGRGGGLAVRLASGEGPVLTLAARRAQVPRSIVLSPTARAGCCSRRATPARVFTTSRLKVGTGERHRGATAPAPRHRLDRPGQRARARYLAVDGVRTIAPPLF